MKKIGKLLLSILAVAIGVLMFVYAGIDDSPGGQLLGLMAVMIGIVGIIRNIRKNSNNLKI